jgi:hypothetical protein
MNTQQPERITVAMNPAMQTISKYSAKSNPLLPSTTGNMTAEQECLQIRRALWALYDLDDRDAWQRDLCVYLLEQDTEDANYDALADARLEGMIKGLDLFFRFFEVRVDLVFRHQVDRFDDDGFLRLSGPWAYSDTWWDTVSQEHIRLAETILVHAGILEFRESDTGRASVSDQFITSMRLRADRIVEVLKNYSPDKYSNLKY